MALHRSMNRARAACEDNGANTSGAGDEGCTEESVSRVVAGYGGACIMGLFRFKGKCIVGARIGKIRALMHVRG